ncbi:MAG: polyhydroxybutyrate depolymerase, partial [Myxococcota bacterium]
GGACEIDEGRYFASAPEGWDGESELPTVVHFHGWNGSPANFFESDAVMAAYSEAGVLVIMPEGEDGTWTVPGSGLEGSGRDELAFVRALLTDVGERWPVDDSRLYVSGHSLGSSMAYHVGCELGEQFAAMSPSSGGFWEPMPQSCPAPPLPVCHIHGENDTTWPYEGRLVEEGSASGTQAHVDDDIAFWRAHSGCGEESESYIDGMLTCETWRDCEDGAEVSVCTHEGGHELPDGWVEREVAWLLRFQR